MQVSKNRGLDVDRTSCSTSVPCVLVILGMLPVIDERFVIPARGRMISEQICERCVKGEVKMAAISAGHDDGLVSRQARQNRLVSVGPTGSRTERPRPNGRFSVRVHATDLIRSDHILSIICRPDICKFNQINNCKYLFVSDFRCKQFANNLDFISLFKRC